MLRPCQARLAIGQPGLSIRHSWYLVGPQPTVMLHRTGIQHREDGFPRDLTCTVTPVRGTVRKDLNQPLLNQPHGQEGGRVVMRLL